MEPNEVEELYVRQVYAKLARQEAYIFDEPSSSSFEYESTNNMNKPWPKIVDFLDQLPVGSLIIDAGCGPLKSEVSGSFRIGFDNCNEELLRSNKNDYHDVIIANALHSPFRNHCADAVLCISMLHHISSADRRLSILNNLAKLLSPSTKSRLMIYVWAEEQPNAKFPAQDILVPWNLHEIKKKDLPLLVPFHKDSTREQRIIQNSIPIEVFESNKSSWLAKCLRNFQKKIFRIERKIPSAIPLFWREKKVEGITKIISGINRWSPMLGNRLKLAMISVEELYATELSITLIEEAMAIGLSSLQKVIYYRFYHVFRQGELEELISTVFSLKLVSITYDAANWCLIAEGKSD